MDLYFILLVVTFVGIGLLVLQTVRTKNIMTLRMEKVIATAEEDRSDIAGLIAAVHANENFDHDLANGSAGSGFMFPPEFLDARRGRGPLGLAWREVGHNLVMTRNGQALSQCASRIFSPELLYHHDVDLRRFEAFPNILVGAGLATTFVLLALTIGVGVSSLNAADTQSISAILPLLQASALKFLTSIFGIGCSIWFIVARDKAVLEAEAALAAIADTLASALPYVSQQTLLANLVIQSAEQNRLSKARNKDLASAVAGSVRVELENGLVAALTPIADRMTDLSQRVAEVNAKQIEMMAAAFARDLGTAIEQYSRTLSEQLETAVNRFAEVPPAIEAAANAYAGAVDDSVIRLRSGAENASEIYSGIEQLLRNLTAAITAADERLNQSVQSFRGELDDGAEGLRTARQALVDALPVVDAMRHAAPAGAALNEAAQTFQRAGVEVAPALAAWQEGLAGLDQGLAHVIARVDELLARAMSNNSLQALPPLSGETTTSAIKTSLPEAFEPATTQASEDDVKLFLSRPVSDEFLTPEPRAQP